MVTPAIYIEFLEKASLDHYRIKSVKYDQRKDNFKISLVSNLKNFPEINVSVSYYSRISNGAAIPMSLADTDDDNYVLNYTCRNRAEEMSEQIVGGLRSILREDKHGKDRKAARLDIFGSP